MADNGKDVSRFFTNSGEMSLETQEEQDRWLSENRETVNAKIRRGIEQLDRGQGIPEDHLDAHLADLKAKPK